MEPRHYDGSFFVSYPNLPCYPNFTEKSGLVGESSGNGYQHPEAQPSNNATALLRVPLVVRLWLKAGSDLRDHLLCALNSTIWTTMEAKTSMDDADCYLPSSPRLRTTCERRAGTRKRQSVCFAGISTLCVCSDGVKTSQGGRIYGPT